MEVPTFIPLLNLSGTTPGPLNPNASLSFSPSHHRTLLLLV
jgi:hypothetical protein